MNIRKRQSGATLVVSLIMLVVLTLLVVSAIRSGNTNLRIAGNTQVQKEATAAAQQAIEQVISTPTFATAPVAQTVTVDNGATSYAVQVSTPTCDSTKPLINGTSDLDPSSPDDQPCLGSSSITTPGIFDSNGNAAPAQAWCSKQQWDVQATVNDSNTGANVTVHQGVGMRVPAGTSC